MTFRKYFLNTILFHMRVLFLRSNTPFGQLLQGLVRIFIRMFLLYCCAFYALDVFLLCCLWRNKRNKSTTFFVLKQTSLYPDIRRPCRTCLLRQFERLRLQRQKNKSFKKIFANYPATVCSLYIKCSGAFGKSAFGKNGLIRRQLYCKFRAVQVLMFKLKETIRTSHAVYQFLSGNALGYLADDCQLVTDARAKLLRSADTMTLTVHGTSSCFGDRTFAAAATRVWNSLPSDLRRADLSYARFGQSLETFLFGQPDQGAF